MRLLASLKIINERTAINIRAVETDIAGIKNEIEDINARIDECHEMVTKAKLHLLTFSIVGAASLSEILESKTRQAVVKRKIAMAMMQQEELNQQKIERQKSLNAAQEKRKTLLRKADKFTNRIRELNKELALKQLNQLDNDLEEQLQWKM